MSERLFKCWCPDDCYEDDAKSFFAFDAESAAIKFAEKMHCEMDYPKMMEIRVRDATSENQKLTEFFVEAEPSVTFRAKEKP